MSREGKENLALALLAAACIAGIALLEWLA
jgi:hypothetical protein